MAEVKMLTARDLAEKAGVSPGELRKLLRVNSIVLAKPKLKATGWNIALTQMILL